MTNDAVPAVMPIAHKLPLMSRRSVALLALLTVLWTALAWLFSGLLAQERIAALVSREGSQAQEDVASISENFERVLNRLQGLPTVLAVGSDVTAALATFGPEVRPSSLTLTDRIAVWTQDRGDLLALGEQLKAAAREMDVDLIWVINASGDCVAASNVAESTSFVGINYADRGYFKSAQAGVRGRQYAMGRVTNVPGLFFSAPVTSGGQFLGAVVIKIDIPQLAPSVNHPHAFVTDEYGVIILAGDRRLEMRAMPGALVHQLPAEQRLARYKRSEFEPLDIKPISDGPAALVRVNGSRYSHVAAHNERAQYGIAVHVLAPIPDIENMRRDAFAAFLLLSFSGVLLIALGFGARAYVLRVRQHRQAIEATNESLNELNEHLDRLARVDSLTGCANRRHFQACLENELARAGRYDRECSLVLVDLDFFKHVNDQHGHLAGDEVLRQIVQIARRELRGLDELGRLGGEEFAILLPETGLASAIAVAERVRRAIEATPTRFGDTQIPLTASFGVACWKSSAESTDALLQRADTALYAAKTGGRNVVASSGAAGDQPPSKTRRSWAEYAVEVHAHE